MQLELIGCTGAGKSTLADRIVEAARTEGIDIALGDDVALDCLGMRVWPSQWLRAASVHLVAFFECLVNGWRYFAFIGSAHHVLRTAKITRRQRWNQFRKVLKQLGRYELIRHRRPDQHPVLVDEGTIHAAHNLFVHVGQELNLQQLQSFAECVPLPDIVVYVRLHEEQLIERTLRRGHPRIPIPTRQSVTGFVRQAVLAFDQVTDHKRIAGRTLVIQDGVIVQQPQDQASPYIQSVLDLLRRAVQPQNVDGERSTV